MPKTQPGVSSVLGESSQRVFARSTTVQTVDIDLGRAFLDQHHHQHSLSITGRYIGLFHLNELLAVSFFCPPRTPAKAREYSVEWARLVFKTGTRVVGGASKIFRYYVNTYHPNDVFTYQDTTGEVTDVYEQCGMRLVGQSRRKEYMVAPGCTLETADRTQALSIAYASRFGPDRILGTGVGEVLDHLGNRKSNRRIFLEDLGWHIETTSGDRVYEWINEDVTFYTYKITAVDSPKYYYGTGHIKHSGATLDQCADDGYYGSVGIKFQNWISRHSSGLRKEILETFTRKLEAYEHEQALVGQLYIDDPNCLNSTAGGMGGFAIPAQWSLRDCVDHGLTSHIGSTCASCRAYSSINIRECAEHGKVKHRGDVCCTCMIQRQLAWDECKVHGETMHQAGVCTRCISQRSWALGMCEIHGEVYHQAGVCQSCFSQRSFSTRQCDVHGNVIHRGKNCMSCSASASWSIQSCDIHGDVQHHGTICQSCLVDQSWSLRVCEIHGETWHHSSTCQKCVSHSKWAVERCEIHGLTPHLSGECRACKNDSLLQKMRCEEHGLVMHRGTACMRCVAQKSWSMQECSEHGHTKHIGDKCSSCSNSLVITTRVCDVHGEGKHRGYSCMRCVSDNSSSVKYCDVHQEDTRHKGNNCMRCSILSSWHDRGAHKNKPHKLCRECCGEGSE